VREKGGQTRKVKWVGRHGAPDRLVLLPGWHFLAELKRPGKDAEDHQYREHMLLRAAGFEVVVLDTIEKIDGVLK
jgi:hypothetical protein